MAHRETRQTERAPKNGTTIPRSLSGASGQDVSLLGNACKQDGGLRERSLQRESALSPGRLGRLSSSNPGNTDARSKTSSDTMASFPHGTEIERDFQKRLLLPPPPAHPPLSGSGGGPSGRRGIRGVRGVRNAEFGGVSHPHPHSSPGLPPAAKPGRLRCRWLLRLCPRLGPLLSARLPFPRQPSFAARFCPPVSGDLLLLPGGEGVGSRNPPNVCFLFLVSYVSDYTLPLRRNNLCVCIEVMGLTLSKVPLDKVTTLVARGKSRFLISPACISKLSKLKCSALFQVWAHRLPPSGVKNSFFFSFSFFF